MQQLRPGDRLRSIDAATWNAMLEAAKAELARQGSIGGRSTAGSQDRAIVRVRNGTAHDLARFDVLGLDAPIFEGRADAAADFDGVLADRAKHFGRWGLLLEPVRAGAIGHALVAGVAAAPVFMDRDNCTHADVRHLDQADEVDQPRLAGDFAGSAHILHAGPRAVRISAVDAAWIAARQTYIESPTEDDTIIFTGQNDGRFTILKQDEQWVLMGPGEEGPVQLASAPVDDDHPDDPPTEGWSSGIAAHNRLRWCILRLGCPVSMTPANASQINSALMRALFDHRGIDPEQWLIERSRIHFHDDSHSGIAFNDVQAIQMWNAATGDNLPVPLVASEGYNMHGHTGPYDGGWLPGYGVHDHRDAFNGGLAFACFHPGTALPQQPWGI